MKIQFLLVKFNEVAERIAELLPYHKDAVYGPAKLDWEQYLAASDANQCFAVVAMDGDKLVGYSVYMIGRNVNHRDLICADNTGFFCLPKYVGLGCKLIKESHRLIKLIGVHEFNYILRDERVEKLIKRMKPSQTFTVYSFNG